MASGDGGRRHWDDDDRIYSSGSHSDESPILSYRASEEVLRCEKRRFVPYTTPSMFEERERRSTFSTLGKFCLFCAAMILFCVLMYIPVYNKANYHISRKDDGKQTVKLNTDGHKFKSNASDVTIGIPQGSTLGFVSGWSIHTNRDTKLYVQPNNVTTVYEPKDVCRAKHKSQKLLLLIIVCSATGNFERRTAIRETFGSYANYKKNLIIFTKIRDKYKKYNYKYDLYPQKYDLKSLDVVKNVTNENVTYGDLNDRQKRDISSLNQLLPVLAKAISNVSSSNSRKTEAVPEKRFDDDDDDSLVPGFDMNKELVNNVNVDFDYEYDSNIMKIPPKGYEDEQTVPDFSKVLDLLKQSKDFDKIKEVMDTEDPEFRLVFLLGMPNKDNGTVQKRIEDEIDEFNDIIQEGFIDSYNNLTLKSIMMLKWVTKNCLDSVRYILKTDDDTYVNVPNLILNLKNRSAEFDKMAAQGHKEKEYLLMGDIISGAKPVLEPDSKWYSPRYMYGGRVYPRYLSGMGYAMSAPTALALYNAALVTHYFHLEDIYITGMCPLRASPRIPLRDDPLFSYSSVRSSEPCRAHAQATAHRVTPEDMRAFHTRLMAEEEVDRCERIRLTKVRQEQIRRRLKMKKAARKADKHKN